MRKLVYFVASSLDGFIAGPDGADPSGPDGFWPIPPDYVQYLVSRYPETLPTPARAAMGITAEGDTFDTVVEGRHSYEIGLKAGVADAFTHLRHIVFSTTLTSDAVEIARDPVETVRALKAESGKDIWLIGGAKLAGSLVAEVNRLIVKLAPLTTGAGIPLFDTTFSPVTWRLTDVHRIDSGALFLTYDR